MKKNIFDHIPVKLSLEFSEIITKTDNICIERIVSNGHSSPAGFWYDQKKNEFVIVLEGSAGLRFYDKNDMVTLRRGDYITIPSHTKHRVEWTDPTENTVWLAVYY